MSSFRNVFCTRVTLVAKILIYLLGIIFFIGNFGLKNFEKIRNFNVKNLLKIGNFNEENKLKNLKTTLLWTSRSVRA